MPIWKILLIMVLACACLGLAMGTIIVPLALEAEDHRWLWFTGFLLTSILMGTLFTVFLRIQDRTFTNSKPRR